MTYRLLVLAMLAGACTGAAAAQGVDIRGVVYDSLTGQPIPHANVMILNTNRGASTNNSGFYLIPSVTVWSYDIAASVIGYRRVVRYVGLTAGTPTTLNFALSAVPVEKGEVLVTAPKRSELSEINTSVHVLDQNDMKLTPVIAQEDVFQSLKIIPGIVSTSDVSSRFYVRGGAGDQNLVLLDGMKIYNPFHALGIFSLFDPEIVKSVDVYTGAYPAEYGGRLSSVVDISTRDGRKDTLAGQAGLNFLSSKIQLEGPAGSTSWLLNVRKSTFSRTFDRIVNQDIPVSFYDFFFKFSSPFAGSAKLDLSFITSSDQLLFEEPNEPNYSWRTTAFSVSGSGLIGDRVFVQASVSNTVYRANRDSKSSTSSTPASNLIDEPGLRVLATYYTNSQALCFFGFDFSFPTIEYKLVNLAGSSIDLTDSFIEAAWWFSFQVRNSPWIVDVGLHTDLASIMEDVERFQGLQPRVTVGYELFDDWRVRASAGLFSQRCITVTNEDDIMSVFDPWIKVPQDLPMESAAHFVLGIDGSIVATTSVSFESYYKYYSSLVLYNRDKILDTDPDFITGTGKSWGAELLLRSKLSGIDLYATYALSWATVDNSGLEYYPRYDRRHHVNLLASSHPLEHVNLSVRWEYGSGFPYSQSEGWYDRLQLENPLQNRFELEIGQPYLVLGKKDAGRLPAYHRLDISASYEFIFHSVRGTFGAQIINVYDKENLFYFDRNTGQRADMLRFFPSATLTLNF